MHDNQLYKERVSQAKNIKSVTNHKIFAESLKMCQPRHVYHYLPWQYQTYSQHKYENPFEAKEHHYQLHGRSTI